MTRDKKHKDIVILCVGNIFVDMGKETMTHKLVSLILPYYNRKYYLKIVLDSFLFHYKFRNDLQIVIVDDKSNNENRVEDLITNYNNLNIKLIRIENKKGINPCYPYNVGVKHSDGDVIILSSPDIIHINNIFEMSNNFELLHNKSYLQFSVFCVTDSYIKNVLLHEGTSFKDKNDFIKNIISHRFYSDLGNSGYPYSNSLGAWYTHSKFKNDCYNFVSACTKDTYYAISGFNELFLNGAGYDDADFRDRLMIYINNNVIWYDDFVAIHIDHPAVTNDNNSNFILYKKLKIEGYKKNNEWGIL